MKGIRKRSGSRADQYSKSLHLSLALLHLHLGLAGARFTLSGEGFCGDHRILPLIHEKRAQHPWMEVNPHRHVQIMESWNGLGWKGP